MAEFDFRPIVGAKIIAEESRVVGENQNIQTEVPSTKVITPDFVGDTQYRPLAGTITFNRTVNN